MLLFWWKRYDGALSAHKCLGPCTPSSRMGARSCGVPCASALLPRAVPHTQEGEWDRCANGGQVQLRIRNPHGDGAGPCSGQEVKLLARVKSDCQAGPQPQGWTWAWLGSPHGWHTAGTWRLALLHHHRVMDVSHLSVIGFHLKLHPPNRKEQFEGMYI